MPTPKSKIIVGTILLLLFLATATLGIILHLKAHGIIVQPRPVIKTIHWICGFLMVIFAVWHYNQFQKILTALKTRHPWFWYDTIAVIFLILATFITGAVKLLSPVKIPHLGLWHYFLGLAMTLFILIHLVRAIPAWGRLYRLIASKRNNNK